ncbi:MAG TPA: hypothetical protein VEK85_04065 [Gemmatimonadales bacterium]|nr:hypothetical protein [Gemmatimonadales bacterium]
MRFTPLLVALVALPYPISAQEQTDTVVHQSSSGFYVAGGVELARLWHEPGYGPALGLSLQAGYARQFSRLGLRLGLAYYERQREYDASFYGGFSDFYHRSDARSVAANVDLTFDLTRSSIRPYVIGGLAIYRWSVESRYDNGTRFQSVGHNGWLVPGVGLRFPMRNIEAFAEARLHIHSGHSLVSTPLTFGIRF